MDEVLKFDDFVEEIYEKKLEEFDGKGQIVKYRYLDYFNNIHKEVRCEVISYNEKRAKIKLLGFGPKGSRPGTIMTKVKHTSLVGFKPEFPVDDTVEYEEPRNWWDNEKDDDE